MANSPSTYGGICSMYTELEILDKIEVPNPNSVNFYDDVVPYYQTNADTVVTQIVGQGAGNMGEALSYMDYNMQKGESVKVEMVLDTIPTQPDLDLMYKSMVASGAHVTKPKIGIDGGLPVVTFNMRKGSPLLGMIVPIIPIVIIGALVTFGIFRIESISKALLPLLLTIVGGAVLVVGLATRPSVVGAAPNIIQSAAQLRR